MPVFLVERYAPRPRADGVAEAAPVGPDEAAGIRLLLSATVPADEIALSLFEAPTREALARALEAWGVSFIRIVEALVEGLERQPAGPGAPASVGVEHEQEEMR